MSAKNDRPTLIPGKPIPVPDNFPVKWERPEDGRLLWMLDGYHYPTPMAPLEFELTVAIYEEGGNRACAEAGVPFRLAARRINTYFYRAAGPDGGPPESVLRLMNGVKRFAPGLIKAIENKAVASMSAKYLPTFNDILDDLDGYWQGTLLPEVKGYLDRWESFDLDQASLPALLAHFEQVLPQAERVGTIHFLIHGPNIFAMSQFEELANDLFGEDGANGRDAFIAYRLLAGFDNMILAGDRMLWELSRKALTMPAVQKVLEESAASEVIARLEESATGQVFLAELNAFLAEHGHRGAMYSTIGEVSWLEDPTPAIKMLKDYITQPDRDLEAELAAEAAERERLVEEARGRLQGYPKPVVTEFERLLKAAQAGTVLHSDHGYWIDYRAMHGLRMVLLALGRRLVEAGVIDGPGDVMFLWLDELKAAAGNPGQVEYQELVAERKAEVAHFRTIKPPATLGTLPLMGPPEGEPLFTALMKTTGDPTQALNGDNPGVLRGNAGSPGVVRGRARVIRSLDQAAKLLPGDILVAETTAPPWTPLFATAAAVVTDAGGVLSHCAVVAREYGIPAVVGASRATEMIQDGQLIEVNGDQGLVHVVA